MYNLFIILTIVINTLPRFIPYMEIWEHRLLYFSAQALSFVLFAIADYYKPKVLTPLNKCIFRIALWFMISNLMDELFFDPVHLGLNEVVFAVFIIITEIIFYIRESKRRTY